jgi:hypothetical protein
VTEFLIVLLVLAALAVFVTGPLRRQRNSGVADPEGALTAERDVQDLEAARDAKYREIRDAELDHGTGKLSDADWRDLDRTLRAEAIEVLKALDRATAELRRRREEVQALTELSEPAESAVPAEPAAAGANAEQLPSQPR